MILLIPVRKHKRVRDKLSIVQLIRTMHICACLSGSTTGWSKHEKHDILVEYEKSFMKASDPAP
jgi:hypothetical protein